MKKAFSIIVLTTTISTLASVSMAAETRCGWIDNNAPNEITLTDKDHTWLISNMSYDANGLEKLPNLPFGNSCACLKVEVNQRHGNIANIISGKLIPNKRCEQDKNLK